jgi:hypothetical protein
MVSSPTNLTTHVQDHSEGHKRVKRWGKGQGVVESAHKLQGPMCVDMVHVCLPKCSCSTIIAWINLQPTSPHMCKTIQMAIKESKGGGKGKGLWKVPTSCKAPCAKNMVNVCLPKCSCSTAIAWFRLQPTSPRMCKTIQKPIKESKSGGEGKGLWKVPTSYKAPCAKNMVNVCLPKCSCSTIIA